MQIYLNTRIFFPKVYLSFNRLNTRQPILNIIQSINEFFMYTFLHAGKTYLELMYHSQILFI